ncbi:glutathione S-transferase family protein [Cupriavidus necator]|uniref:Glutathione S-transferase family protein n=1 Tax=Cupriavidus necator TaxID=106590 RepID=A0A367PQR9_CUPNE|nr:glutathione S-transferase family protein [Cupriavidus necator]QQX85839.1 glutathione S-transferase family protein [Cupriavidus necator]RCJ10271.1 glutathione S-transferase family protein [Cupriavidus necator]
MADIILHQYATSPFSEKVRLLLGAKGLAWQAVEIPAILPKPDLLALTGGYRRTPVMQVGADIYCDTALICEVLDALAPAPALYPPAQAAAARVAAAWFDAALFTASVTYVFQPAGVASMLGHLSPAQVQAFSADRKAMRGDTNALRMPLPEATALLHETFGQLETQFSAGIEHVAGPALSVADFSLYHNLWFIRRAGALAQLLEAYPRLQAWYARMNTFGHGRPRVIDSEDAIAAARSADPVVLDEGVVADAGLQAGDPVTVTPTDYARDPVAGVLLSLTARRVTLRRQDPRAGALNVHFPRQGYQVQRAA